MIRHHNVAFERKRLQRDQVAAGQPESTKSRRGGNTVSTLRVGLLLVLATLIMLYSHAGYMKAGIVCPVFSQKDSVSLLPDATTKQHDDGLPIVPRTIETSSPLNHFFATYPDNERNSGWIDVNQLPLESIQDLRTTARQIAAYNTTCGHPQVQSIVPPSGDGSNLEYCFWDNDFVSRSALDNFSFEKEHWSWVVKAFSYLRSLNITKGMRSIDELGFLDVGVNVGDWISPIRLLAPTVPIYGIEGSPATAAIATANLRTSVEYARRSTGVVAPSKILPYTLSALSQTQSVRQEGGVCFAKVIYYRGTANVGGRSIEASGSCPPSAAAGATTLLHAVKGLVADSTPTPSFPTLEWPRIFVMKIDIEGHEFKALSSVIPWLSAKPPCYIAFEYTGDKTSSHPMVELFLDLGYDAAWKTRNGEFPMDTGTPWWDKDISGGKALHQMVKKDIGGTRSGYGEVIVGFKDVDKCVMNLLAD